MTPYADQPTVDYYQYLKFIKTKFDVGQLCSQKMNSKIAYLSVEIQRPIKVYKLTEYRTVVYMHRAQQQRFHTHSH